MKRSLLIVSSLILLTSCSSNKQKVDTKKVIADTLTSINKVSYSAPSDVDTTIIHMDSALISGNLYITILKNTGTLYILKREDTILKKAEALNNIAFEDIDRDGYKDITITYFNNGEQELLLFDKHAQTFKEVDNFISFPAPEHIPGTKYYYSYHRSGCADLNWDSDLFFIQNYKAIRIGNIAGYGCRDRNMKDGIYIHRVKNGKETLVKTLPISNIDRKDYKWGFIKDYWTKNYKKFL